MKRINYNNLLKHGIGSVIMATLLVAQASSASTSNVTPIQFDKGGITSIVEGVLSANQNDHRYQFTAQSGQYAIVNITGLDSVEEVASAGIIITPSGKQDGSKGGIVYQQCLPETGTYDLKIARNNMITDGGLAGYHVEVVILPSFASQGLCS